MMLTLAGTSLRASWYPGDDVMLSVSDGDIFFIRGDWGIGTEGTYLDTYRWLGAQYPQVTEAPKLISRSYISSPGETYAFVAEDAETTIAGYPAFYIKNLSKNMYLAKDDSEGGNSSSAITLVASKAEACLWGFKPVSEMYEMAPEEAMQMFTLANNGSTVVYYNNNYDGNNDIYIPKVATFTDGTTWQSLIMATECGEEDALIDQLLDIYTQVEGYYPAEGGDAPGFFSAEVAEEFNAAYVECNIDDILDRPDYSVEMLRKARDRFEAIAIKILQGPEQLADGGYYYVISTYDWTVNPDDLRAIYESSNVAYWATLEPRNAEYIWQFHKVSEGQYTMQNFLTGMYVVTVTNNGSSTLGSADDKALTIASLGSGQFNLRMGSSTSNNMHCKGHSNGTGTSGSITGYPGGKSSQSSWRFRQVDQDIIDSLNASVERERIAMALHDSIEALVGEVSAEVKTAFEYEVTGEETDVTPLSEADFDSNAAMSAEHGYSWGNDGQGYGALIDNDVTTYFHTAWNTTKVASTSYDADGNPTGTPTVLHNLGMHLTQPVSTVAFLATSRQGNYNNPTKINVEVSEDGENWTTIFYGYDFYTPNHNTTPYVMGSFDLGGEYEYVRFANYANDRNKDGTHFFCISELRVYDGISLTSNCQASTIDRQVVADFLAAYSEANKYLDVYGPETIEAMEAAITNLLVEYEHFCGVFANPEALQTAIAAAQDVIANFRVGEGQVGLYPETASTVELEAAVAEGQDLLAAGNYTQAAVDAAAAKIAAAQQALEAQVILPNPEKWYMFQFANAEEYDALGYSEGDGILDRVCTVARTYADSAVVYYDDLSSLRMSAYMYAAPLDEVPSSDLYSFRFIPLEDGYAIQNKATGLFIQNLGWSASALLGAHPGLFKVAVLGQGFCVLESYDLATGEGREGGVNTLHFCNPAQWYQVRGWPDHKLATKSALKVIEMDDASEDDEMPWNYRNTTEGEAYVATYNANITDVENVELYTVVGEYQDEETGQWYVGLSSIYEAEAGQPVILRATSSVAAFRFGTTIAAMPQTAGGLVGVLDATTTEGDVIALLSNTEYQPRWTVVTGAQAISAGAGYLSGSLDMLTEDDLDGVDYSIAINKSLTGVQTVSGSGRVTNGSVLYDLSGRRMAGSAATLRPGLYILDSKKVLVP